MRTFVICLALLVVCTSAASAQVSFGIQGNLVNFKVSEELKQWAGIPTGSTESQALEQIYGMGYGGGIHLDFSLGILSFRVTGDYVTLTPDQAKFESIIKGFNPAFIQSAKVEGGRIEVIGGAANIKFVFLPLPAVKPYITGGIGWSQVKAQDAKITITPVAPATAITTTLTLIKKQTPMTLNGGAGVDLVFGGLSLYAEVKVTGFFLEGGTSTYLPIGTVGLTF